MSIVPHRPQRNPHPQERVAETRPTIAPDRHWYIAGPGGYCQACNLPQSNGRHAPRAT